MRAWGLLLLAVAQSTAACGFCIEDRIAAVYDHGVVQAAVARHRHVAFLGFANAPNPASRKAIVQTAEGIPGVVSGSVRISIDSSALSFAFDPTALPASQLVEKLNARLTKRGMSITLLQDLDRVDLPKTTVARH